MSKSLCKRLEDLEDEIRVLLTIQDVKSDCCNTVKGKAKAKSTDLKPKKTECEGSNCTKFICGPPPYCDTSCIPKTEKPKTAKSACVCSLKEPQHGDEATKSDSEFGGKGYKSDSSKRSKKSSKSGKSKKTQFEKNDQDQDKDQPIENQEVLLLEAKLADLEARLQKSEDQRSAILAMNSNLKTKNEELRASAKEVVGLKKENEELLKQLKIEEESRYALEEKSKLNLEKEKKTLERKMEKLGVDAAKSSRKLRKHSEELASALKTRDDQIRKLSNTTDQLVGSITEKENEKRRLLETHEESMLHFVEIQSANRKLLETNTSLLKNLKDLQEKLQFEKQYSQKLTKQNSQCRSDTDRFKEEIDRLRARLKSALESPIKAMQVAKLEESLRESREREEVWLNEAALMEARLKELQEKQDRASEAFDSELELMQVANSKLKSKYERAIDQVEQLKTENEAKLAEMKSDFDKILADYGKKLDHLRKEKKSLEEDFKQLAAASKEDREVLEQLIVRTKKQDEVIASQQEAIRSKDNKVANLIKLNDNLKEQLESAEKIANDLKNILEEQKSGMADFQAELNNLKEQLKAEQEECHRKDVIIAEQACKAECLQRELTATEEKLKHSMDECQAATEEVNRTMKELTEISCKLRVCEARAETMKQMGHGQKEPTMEQGDGESLLQKVTNVSLQFDKKIELMQKERQLQIDLVLKEKDRAIYAAKFATQKLLETVTDFQKQVEVHKQTQLMLTRILQEKEEAVQSMQCCPPCSNNAKYEKKSRSGSRGRCSYSSP